MTTSIEKERRVLNVGYLTIQPDAFVAELHGRFLPLTTSQVELLRLLIRRRHRVVTRAELAAAAGLEQQRSVDVVLSSLRRLFGEPFVRNVRNRGWILEPHAFER
jgi:DNA-binding response OmpR family regulator